MPAQSETSATCRSTILPDVSLHPLMGHDAGCDLASRYEFKDLLGRGGVGGVWLAYDRVLGRDVAVKVAENEELDSADLAERFKIEAAIQASLRHPSVPPVYDSGVDAEGRPYITMDHVEGGSLESIVARCRTDAAYARTWTIEARLELFVELCRAVAYVHAHDVVHCDLKPANVLIGLGGAVYLIDWGLAINPSANFDVDGLDEVVGSPGYMAPEQLRGRGHVSVRTDVYALGCMLFELLTDRPVLDTSEGYIAWAYNVLEGVDARPSRVLDFVPEALDSVCAKATAVDPNARFESVDALIEAVSALLPSIAVCAAATAFRA